MYNVSQINILLFYLKGINVVCVNFATKKRDFAKGQDSINSWADPGQELGFE